MADDETGPAPAFEPVFEPEPAEPSEPDGAGGGRPAWLLWVVIVVLAVVVGVVASQVFKDDDSEPERTLPSLDDAASLDADRLELLSLLREAHGKTVHAVYEQNTGARIEVWRRGEQSRTDTRAEIEGQATEFTDIHGPDQNVSCRRTGTGPWACEPSDALPSFERSIESELALRDVKRGEETEIGGRKARCYTLAGDDQTSTVCVDDGGLIVRLQGGDTDLTLVEADEDVPADAFTPPA